MITLLNISDSTRVSDGHQQITDQINILSTVITAMVVVGLIFIIRWIILEKVKKRQ